VTSKITTLTVFIDKTYLYPAVVMLSSANQHLDSDINFVIGTFSAELSNEDKAAVTKILYSKPRREVSFVEISKQKLINEIQHIDTKQHFGYAAFGRLHLQDLIEERHIYSDVDVIFTPGSNRILQELPETSSVGFVNQASALARSELDFDLENKEFFSGFISWPIKKHRPKFDLKSLKPWKTQHSTHDQALLNSTLNEGHLELTPDLCQLDNPVLRTSNFGPGILHFFGNWKPWHARDENRNACIRVGCSWVFWFEREDTTFAMAKKLNLDSWLLAQKMRSYEGMSFNLRAMQFILRLANAKRIGGLFPALFRKLLHKEYHLVH
jgi:lipopolysaccharide biosynthesis glycosyltransferase